jgi:hypothetical protein
MWQAAVAANLVTSVAYLLIAGAIVVPLIHTKQVRSNQLGMATAAIFFTCAVHHGSHSVHMLLPIFGLETHAGYSLRAAFEWHIVIWDIVTAAVGFYYWTLRRTYGPLMRGASLFEDLKEKQRRALEINDNIVQGLVVAETALAFDQRDLSREALATTLTAARQIITDLLGEADSETRLGPGDLRRKAPAIPRDPST